MIDKMGDLGLCRHTSYGTRVALSGTDAGFEGCHCGDDGAVGVEVIQKQMKERFVAVQISRYPGASVGLVFSLQAQ